MAEDDHVSREDSASKSDVGAHDPSDAPVESVLSAKSSVEDQLPGVFTRARKRWLTPRTLGLALALAGLCTLLGVEVVFIAKSNSQRKAKTAPPLVALKPPNGNQPAGAEAAPSSTDTSNETVEAAPSIIASPEASAVPAPEFFEEGVSDEQAPAKPEKPKHFKTVQEASTGSCSTSSVDGLSRQIIEQVRCTNPSSFVPLPSRPNLALDSHIFPYFEQSARDHLLRVLDANRQRKMTIHSARRTVAQQYLVWRWSANRRCGVPLATPPGSSNHETGRALDIADQAEWRSAMEAQDFHWLGASDIVHFDYKTNRAMGPATDVLAFQRLWNRNHPDDRIAESGQYDPNTEQRLKKSPPGGFASGSTCAKKSHPLAASR